MLEQYRQIFPVYEQGLKVVCSIEFLVLDDVDHGVCGGGLGAIGLLHTAKYETGNAVRPLLASPLSGRHLPLFRRLSSGSYSRQYSHHPDLRGVLASPSTSKTVPVRVFRVRGFAAPTTAANSSPMDDPQQHALVAMFHYREAVMVVVSKDRQDGFHCLDRPQAYHLL